MVVGITDEVDDGSSYKETSGGTDGAGTEETTIELILTFFFCVYGPVKVHHYSNPASRGISSNGPPRSDPHG